MKSSCTSLASSFAMLLLAIASSGHGETIATTQPAPANISQFIAQLGSDSAKVRDTAQQRLTDIGVPAEPELKKAAADNEDPEIRSRAAAILSQLSEQTQIQPTLITLHTKSAGPQEVLNLIGDQAHAHLTVVGLSPPTPTLPGHTVTIDADQQPFWEVMINVCGQLNICPNVAFNENNAMMFRPAWENWMAKSPHQIVGPYWVSVQSLTHTRISALAGDPVIHDQFTVNMIVFAEPRLVVTHYSDFNVEEATDDAGHSMMPRPLPPNIHLPMRRAQNMNHSLEFALAYPQEQAGSKIAILRGNIDAVVAQDFQQYQIDDCLGTPVVNNPLQGADVQFHVVPQGSEYHVDLKCTRGKLPQDQWTALVNCMSGLTLENGQGHALTVVRPLSMHSMSDAPGLEFFSADATFLNNSPISATQSATSEAAGPLRLRWNFPQSFKTMKIEATFKDLQMP